VQKVFRYDPTLSYNTSVTDREMNGRTTDDNDAKDAVQHSCCASKIYAKSMFSSPSRRHCRVASGSTCVCQTESMVSCFK